MKSLLIILSIFISFNSFAWVVTEENKNFYLKSNKRSFIIQSVSGKPHFIKAEKLEQGLERIIYHAGVAGTSDPQEVQRALLISVKSGKVLGDFPISYKSTKKDGELLKADWTFSDGQVEVYDPESEQKLKIKIE